MVASVGIAATALFTFQPALASLAPGSIPGSCLNSCQALQIGFTPNNKCLAMGPGVLRCLCTALIASGLETCLLCFVSIGTIAQSDVDNNVNNFTTKCAQGGFPIPASGSSSLSGIGSATGPSATSTGVNATGANDTSSNTLPVNTGSSTTNAASKMSISSFGVMITIVICATAPLLK